MVEGSTTIITGSLGGGKSAHAVELLCEHLSLGGTVVTNIPVFAEKVRAWMAAEYALVFDPARLILLVGGNIREFQEMAVRGTEKRTVLMVLDEAALDLNAHDHRTLARETFNFVVLVRKLGIDLVFVAQDANDVDKQIRQKMQREVHCRSLKKFLSLGGLFGGLPVFVRVTYVLELGKKPWRQGAKFSYGSFAFGLYDSRGLHGDKAKAFGALALATDVELGRVQIPVWPFALCAFALFAVALVTTSILI